MSYQLTIEQRVNVRLFRDVATAAGWLADQTAVKRNVLPT
jgi:hypothetical protein